MNKSYIDVKKIAILNSGLMKEIFKLCTKKEKYSITQLEYNELQDLIKLFINSLSVQKDDYF